MAITKFGFTLFELEEFRAWITALSVPRTVKTIQQHHTWSPSYQQFTGTNHFAIQKGMKEYHVGENGWSDIGQHFTIFPDGTIMTGRSLNRSPACIRGNNSGAICIENLGNFDQGKDEMSVEQQGSVTGVTAALLKRFSLITADELGIIYHHWFELSTGARTNGAGMTKSCPGTNFFGGNDLESFRQNFLPAVQRSAEPLPSPKNPSTIMGWAIVTWDTITIRRGPKATFQIAKEHGPLEVGTILRVYQEKNDWIKISNSKDIWVYSRFTKKVTKGKINRDETNVRTGPGTDFVSIGSTSKGATVFVREEQKKWSLVGADMWVRSSLITAD